jgi:hypothetical protein
MGALGPTLFAKKTAKGCTQLIGSPSGGPSYAAATRTGIPFLYSGGVNSCGSGEEQIRIRLFVEPGLVFPESLGDRPETPRKHGACVNLARSFTGFHHKNRLFQRAF